MIAPVAVAHAAGGPWSRLAKHCADRLTEAAPDASLGILYATDVLADDLSSIVTFLRERTGIADWVGTVGFGICATGTAYFDQPAVAAMALALPRDDVRVFPAITGVQELAAACGAWAARSRPMFALVHAGSRTPKLAELLDAVAESTGCFLVGGVTASRGMDVQIAGTTTEGGLSGVLFGGELEVATALSHGASPIGPPRTVSSCEGSVLFEIDGLPAIVALMDDCGVDSLQALAERAAGLHVGLPIAGSDTGDYLVRNLAEVDPRRGWVAIGAPVGVGDRILFCRRDRAAAEADLARMLAGLRQRLGNRVPRAGVYVSCVARGPNLFDRDGYEVEAIAQALGDFPLVGFYGNGEISHRRLYGYTGVLTVFA